MPSRQHFLNISDRDILKSNPPPATRQLSLLVRIRMAAIEAPFVVLHHSCSTVSMMVMVMAMVMANAMAMVMLIVMVMVPTPKKWVIFSKSPNFLLNFYSIDQ